MLLFPLFCSIIGRFSVDMYADRADIYLTKITKKCAKSHSSLAESEFGPELAYIYKNVCQPKWSHMGEISTSAQFAVEMKVTKNW